MPSFPRRFWAFPLAVLLGVLPGTAQGDEAPGRHTGETADQTIEAQKKRALATKAGEADQIAALTVIASLADQGSNGLAEKTLADIAAASGPSAEVKGEAAA